MDEGRVKVVTCATWVPRGVAKANPDKVEVTKEDLARILEETKENVKDLEEIEEDEYEDIENEAKEGENADEDKEKENVPTDEVMEEIEEKEEEVEEKEATVEMQKVEKKKAPHKEENFDARYQLDTYDEEEDDKMEKLLQLGRLTLYPSTDDDPLITVKDADDVDSENENNEILPQDNLVVVGQLDGEAAIMEVYVYNSEESTFYIHHDILLPSVPLCMEWLNYDPDDEELKPGNLVAVGSMSPVIDVWDLDVMDGLEPAYTLGKKAKKKKTPGIGHKDAVLGLAWNKHADHVLASGSVDQTVILWDLQGKSVAQTLTSFEEKVQSLHWHHQEAQTLLTGSCDSKVRMFDCRGNNTCKMWKLDGEVENAVWDTWAKEAYSCLASTDKGTVYYIDARMDKPKWTLNAHTEACTALRMSPKCPGFLVTVSADKSAKVWDIASGKPEFIEESNPKLGLIQCLAVNPDAPFVFCMGGDNKEDNFKVWDARHSKNVRSRFCPRVGLDVDEDEEEEEKKKEMESVLEEPEAIATALKDVNISSSHQSQHSSQRHQSQGGYNKNKKKFHKKKGGHLDKFKRK
ncbi:PWP1 homolog no child left behind [Oratosquilla oratoria]|uniref:PWP1 homolog no child left behind n=1 Tax=Oratosquilla oratoria TaxID=337810 RepID=UPI003F767EFC